MPYRARSVLFLSAVLCIHCSAEAPAPPDPTVVSDDPGTGTELGDDTPLDEAGIDPCLADDACVGPVEAPDAGTEPPKSGPPVGSDLVVRAYAGMHVAADTKSALVTSVEPKAGVKKDGVHLWGNPLGYVPPSQVVTLVASAKTNGYYQVSYEGKTGFISASKLALVDPAMDPVDFALQPALRNAFFKHQIHRTRWNKDGPSHSGNCAPTSLAMAVRILGKEPAGLSVEESIHRVRLSYATPVHDDDGPTSRLQIHQAATKLGLSAKAISNGNVTATAALDRLKGELQKKRLVVLEGQTGDGTGKPTIYQKAMNKAYAAAIAAGETLYHSTYDFDGYHSILVLGLDANDDYVVGDPFSEVGFVTLTPAQMKDFVTRWVGQRGTGNAVYLP